MGWFDYVSDVYSSLSIQGASADGGKIQDDMHSASGDFNSSKDQRGPEGFGTAQHRGATTKGGVSTDVPAAGTNEESDSEKEANRQDEKTSQGSTQKGHVAGDESGKAAAGQVGRDNAGPHGGPVGNSGEENKAAQEDDSEDEADEEEDEDEDEPKDPKEQLEEDCAKSKQCAPYKHHYDECVERVTEQQGKEGKADEDCVEEFFHLAHCATQCAAPKLFKQLR